MMRLPTILLILLATTACSKERAVVKPPTEDSCSVAVKHVSRLLASAGAGAAAAGGERAISSTVTEASIAKCRAEGLSAAQSGCILSAQTLEQMLALSSCPAIRDRKPSWLLIPSLPK